MAMSLDYRPSLRGRGDDTLMQQALPDLSSMPRLPDPSESCKGADRMIKMLHGTTTLAFKYKDGVVVCVDSRASSGTYVSSQTVKKVIEFNKMMVGTMAGGAADCFYWLNNMGMRCRLFELEHKEQITVAAASKLFSNITYNYKQYGLSIVRSPPGVALSPRDPSRSKQMLWRARGNALLLGDTAGSAWAHPPPRAHPATPRPPAPIRLRVTLRSHPPAPTLHPPCTHLAPTLHPPCTPSPCPLLD